MKRVCGWCGKIMDPGKPGDTDISHGICPPCEAIWRADAQASIDALKREEAKR